MISGGSYLPICSSARSLVSCRRTTFVRNLVVSAKTIDLGSAAFVRRNERRSEHRRVMLLSSEALCIIQACV